MNTNSLINAKEKMLSIHEKAAALYEAADSNVPKALINEYMGKVSQYENMYQSLEDMKELSSSEDAKAALISQQIKVLCVRAEVEADLIARALKY